MERSEIRRALRQIATPVIVVLLVAALIIGTVGGYFAASQLNKNQASQSAFLPYTDGYGGLLDDSHSGFVTNAPLVAGFSNGQIAWYWFVGPTNNTVNPVYFFNHQNGGAVTGQYPIIDAKPGDQGYTHFWQIFNVTVSDNYVPNTIKSVSSLKRAEQAGLATETDAKRVLDGPLVARNVKITVVNGEPVLLPAWYRTQTTTVAVFETNLPSGNQPSISIWLIQRDSDQCPLLEVVCNNGLGKDFNHDSDIKDSNDLIGTTPGQAGYFPLWAVSKLHVHDNYLANGFPSPFPQNPATLKSQLNMFTSFADAQADQNAAPPTYVDLSFGNKGVTPTGNLVNCPALPLGVEPPAIDFS